jgi:type II secretory pathway predicted ATPase ExeA
MCTTTPIAASGKVDQPHLASDIVIPYPHYNRVHGIITELMEQRPYTSCPISGLLFGASGAGKTTLCRDIVANHPRILKPDRDIVPVFMSECPADTTLKGMVLSLLDDLGEPFAQSRQAQRESKDVLTLRLIRLLSEMRTELVIIDEIHNLLDSPKVELQRCLAYIKTLTNKLQIPILLVGTYKAASIRGKDPQIKRRYMPIHLKPFPDITSDSHARREFLILLHTMEHAYQLKPEKCLTSPETALYLYRKSQGLVGILAGMVKQIARKALRDRVAEIHHSFIVEQIETNPLFMDNSDVID